MRRPIVGFALGLVALAVAACGNDASPRDGGTGGRSGGVTSAGGSSLSGGTLSSTTGGTAGTSSAAGGATGSGGSSPAGGSKGDGTTDSGHGGATSAGGSFASDGATGGGATVDTTGTSSAAGGATGGATSTGGSATSPARPDAGADSSTDGPAGSPDMGRDGTGDRDVSSDSPRFDVAADRALDAVASTCTCVGKPAPVCTPTGHLSYTLSQATSPTADQVDAYKTIACAMDMAVAYYNCYSNITGSVRVSYDTSVSTADGNINGSIRFGSGRQYMTCATSMHEIAHTQGIGTASQWAAHVSGGLFVGSNAAAQLQAINATLATPLYTSVHADGMHFWPYGLNYDSEATGIDILIDHCQMVVAIRKDLGL